MATLDWLHEHACSRSYGLGELLGLFYHNNNRGTCRCCTDCHNFFAACAVSCCVLLSLHSYDNT